MSVGLTQVLWRSRAGLFELRERLGEEQRLRVYPNFSALARYAWLSGDRRLQQIGIKNLAARHTLELPLQIGNPLAIMS